MENKIYQIRATFFYGREKQWEAFNTYSVDKEYLENNFVEEVSYKFRFHSRDSREYYTLACEWYISTSELVEGKTIANSSEVLMEFSFALDEYVKELITSGMTETEINDILDGKDNILLNYMMKRG